MNINGASYRDPAGFVYSENNEIFRQVNPVYRENYDLLFSSGLYSQLSGEKLLIKHTESEPQQGAYKTLKPSGIPFISYPYEWCFEQLKAAALLTLDIQKKSMEKGMSLKDASAYNVQFIGASPVFIDTLSFEKYSAGRPWAAYGQFCSHFLAPLALMSYKDFRLGRMAAQYADGIPLDLASGLLPWASWFKPGIMAHIHLHAASRSKYAGDSSVDIKSMKVSRFGIFALVDSLFSAVLSLKAPAAPAQWDNYYEDNSYTSEALEDKKRLVLEMAETAGKQAVAWDLGANTGLFSRIASSKAGYIVAFDNDYNSVVKNYRQAAAEKDEKMLPLYFDLANPSPSIGWENGERMTIAQRGPAGCVLALALIHHLAITCNLPMERLASFFGATAKNLIIEFVPKDDPQVKRLLHSREDIFNGYNEPGFIKAFEEKFEIIRKDKIAGSNRVVYLMKGK
ncbi:MAG: SAM-dependent methyltransferase [Candidatus Goldiibacteriota bacterium]|jgi:ribosomal protein L11 methylase PrmA